MPYKVGVIGSTGRGNYGHGLDKVWEDLPATTVTAVADDDPDGLRAAAARLGKVTPYADYREMLEKEKPDLVSVAPRWLDQHHDMVLAAAEAGVRGIYMEKPMCRSLREADSMVAACEKHGCKLAIAYQTRYSPKLRQIVQLIDSGKLGNIIEIRGRGKEDRRGGGEDLWVLGSHVMNLMHTLFGEPRWCWADVRTGGRPVTGGDVAEGNEGIGPLAGDAIHATFGFDSGIAGFFDSVRDRGGSPTRFGLTVYGSEGVLQVYTGFLPAIHWLPDSSWSPGRSGKEWIPVTSRGPGVEETLEDGGLHAGNVAACRDLIQAVEQDRQPEASIYEARVSTEMIVSVFESRRQGKAVDLPLANRDNPLTRLPS